jgi:hypothetical protein
VLNFQAMLFCTDIPDWIICEGFGRYEYDFKTTGNPSLYDELYKRSPISHIENVTEYKESIALTIIQFIFDLGKNPDSSDDWKY